MDFRVETKIGVPATSDALWDVLSNLEDWNRWNPVFVKASGSLGLGATINLTEQIEGLGRRAVQARLGDWSPYAKLVWAEKRGWQFTSTHYVVIDELARGNCIVTTGAIFGGMRGEGYFMKHRRNLRIAYQAMNEALRDQALARES